VKVTNWSQKVSIVLVEPQSPGNVGMVCRAMKNMGLSDLRLVKPCSIEHPEALKFAVSAKDLLSSAHIFPALQDALADTEISVATTRRHGKYRQEIFTPREIVQRIGEELGANRAALVFGREDNGLTTDEVSMCRYHATIPTSDEYGSLNLAQAVLVFCYELFNGLSGITTLSERSIATVDDNEAMFQHMERTLVRIGFLNPQNPGHLMKTLRRIFLRSQLDEREVTVMRGMMTQIDWAAHEFKGKK
jgi:tRNA/rRNA methyltransferase